MENDETREDKSETLVRQMLIEGLSALDPAKLRAMLTEAMIQYIETYNGSKVVERLMTTMFEQETRRFLATDEGKEIVRQKVEQAARSVTVQLGGRY